jgi:hypothetical protein
MGKMVRGRSNGLEAGGRAVSSTLAALVAVLIIVAGAVLSLVMLAYFTSVAVQGADVERLAQKSRETVKLAIGYEEVKDEEGVKYLTKMQLKNAWSGTTEITYAVVLDRQGRVMYERAFDPPLTLYASEIKFMKPSELVPELAPYDGDWWKMRTEVGLIVLHTRLGNRFTSFYETPGAPVVVLPSTTSDITYILVYFVTTETTMPTTTTFTSVYTWKIYITEEEEAEAATVTETVFVSGGGGIVTVGVACTTNVVDPELTPTTTVSSISTRWTTVQGGTYTSTKTEYPAPTTVTVTRTVTSTSTTVSYTTETVEETTTITTMFWAIIAAARGILEALRPEIPILFGAIVLLGAPDRFYKYIGRNWKRTMAILVVLTLAVGYLAGMGIGVEVAGAVTLTSTSTITHTFYSPIITTTTTSVQIVYRTVTFKSPTTIVTVTVTITTGGGAGGGGTGGGTSTVCTSTSTVYNVGSTVTVYTTVTTTATSYISPTTVYTTVTQSTGTFREVVTTVTSWTTTTKTSTTTTTITYYPCVFFIGLSPCQFLVGVY